MEMVIAVVVTYNRWKLLTECITALRNQTRPVDKILVINNGSTDNTEKWLKQQSDLYFITQKNVGSSGGFSTGIREALNERAHWIWCMDDDGYPSETALEKLLESDDGSLCLRNCAVIDKNDKETFVWKTGHYHTIKEVDKAVIHGIGHPFNGTLLSRNIIERVGLPRPQFFLWGDETEYYYRIVKQHRIPVCTIADSIHYHPATAFSLKQDWDFKSGWKMYYYIRNRFHIHNIKFNSRFVAAINYTSFLIAFAGITLLFQKTDKFKKVAFILWPMMDAIKGNFEATPTLILSKLEYKQKNFYSRSFLLYAKNISASLLSLFLFSRRRTAGA